MKNSFRIVFQGRIRAGLDPAQVRQQAALRLKASPEQVERIFSGARVVLKQQLDAAQGQTYLRALEQLGLIVALEETPAATPAPQPAQPAAPARPKAEECHFQRTHINLARAEALLKAASPPAPKPREEAWQHETSTERLERIQQKLVDAAAQLRESPAPAQVARQSLPAPEAAPAVQAMPQMPSARFVCSHCGTEHRVESQLQLSITPVLHITQKAG